MHMLLGQNPPGQNPPKIQNLIYMSVYRNGVHRIRQNRGSLFFVVPSLKRLHNSLHLLQPSLPAFAQFGPHLEQPPFFTMTHLQVSDLDFDLVRLERSNQLS